MKIIIFGTGSTAEEAIKNVNKSISILAISDNDKNKWGGIWNGFRIVEPFNISNFDYDYILICSMYTFEIIESLIQKGIKRDKIIPYFKNIDWQSQTKKEDEIRGEIFNQRKGNDIALLTRRNSGCNCRALYSNMPKSIIDSFDVNLVDFDSYKEKWRKYETSFTTHMEGRNFKNRLNIETWHGFPLKSLGVFEKNCVDNLTNVNNGIDYILSYSNLYSFIMSSVYKIDISKFIPTGMPRNDLLVNSNSKSLISKMIERDITNKQIFFYVPTFRKRINKNVREGINVVSQENEFEIIDNFMRETNSYFIIKKHPVEEDVINQKRYENIFFLTDKDFLLNDIDFYEILGGSDVLITDYSSVYFDFLLLNKPIVFWTKDQDVYAEKRGFLFEDPENMMPGPKVKNVKDLIHVISRFIHDKNWYSTERNAIKKLVHKYDDFDSSKRVWDFFLSIYNQKGYGKNE